MAPQQETSSGQETNEQQVRRIGQDIQKTKNQRDPGLNNMSGA
jgi:hypothetical protein